MMSCASMLSRVSASPSRQMKSSRPGDFHGPAAAEMRWDQQGGMVGGPLQDRAAGSRRGGPVVAEAAADVLAVNNG
jgi:hypothetical protein